MKKISGLNFNELISLLNYSKKHLDLKSFDIVNCNPSRFPRKPLSVFIEEDDPLKYSQTFFNPNKLEPIKYFQLIKVIETEIYRRITILLPLLSEVHFKLNVELKESLEAAILIKKIDSTKARSIIEFMHRFNIEADLRDIIDRLVIKNGFDYRQWWRDLDSNWQKGFRQSLAFACILNKIESRTSNNENPLSNLNPETIERLEEMDFENFKGLMEIGGVVYQGSNNKIDLTPLSIFFKLDSISLYNVEIENLEPLYGLRKITRLVLDNVKMKDQLLIDFKRINSKCEIVQRNNL